MRTKKRWYFVWMLVFVLLVFVGCKEKPGETEITGPEIKDGQEKYVEKALKEIVKLMKTEPAGVKSNNKKIKRSLAIHILRDHVALKIHFQKGDFGKMIDYLGDAQVKIGESGGWEVPDADFWEGLHLEKMKLPDAASTELVIYADDISLTDIEPIDKDEDKKDCKSTEFFKFKIIALDKNGNVISNQDGEGERDRRHSQGCPWG